MSAAAPSAIIAMHAAYEAAYTALEKIERAEAALADTSDNVGQRFLYRRSVRDLAAETASLRISILYQVPDSFHEAIILQFHLWSVVDWIEDGDIDKREAAAIVTATDTLFDFMACEFSGVDHEAIGPSFKGGTMLAWKRRRTRTADTEELA